MELAWIQSFLDYVRDYNNYFSMNLFEAKDATLYSEVMVKTPTGLAGSLLHLNTEQPKFLQFFLVEDREVQIQYMKNVFHDLKL